MSVCVCVCVRARARVCVWRACFGQNVASSMTYIHSLLTTHNRRTQRITDALRGMKFRSEHKKLQRRSERVLLAQKLLYLDVRIFDHCTRPVVQPPVCEKQCQFLHQCLRVLRRGGEGEDAVGGARELPCAAATFVVGASEAVVAATQSSVEQLVQPGGLRVRKRCGCA